MDQKPNLQTEKGRKRDNFITPTTPSMEIKWQGKKIIRGGLTVGNTTRILSLTICFELPAKKNRSRNSKYHNLCLTKVYFPHSGYKENEIESFNNEFPSYLTNILSLPNSSHIIGADTNSSIGTRVSISRDEELPPKNEDFEPDTIYNLIGPFGNPRISKTGQAIHNLMREYQIRAASSFFDNNNKYNTWLAPPQSQTEKRKAYQLDQIFISKNQLCHTTNIKRKFDGATSDHAALFIKFNIPNGPPTRKETTQRQ